jgi:hypothetical protein
MRMMTHRNVIILSAIILRDIILSVLMLSVIVLTVLAPFVTSGADAIKL